LNFSLPVTKRKDMELASTAFKLADAERAIKRGLTVDRIKIDPCPVNLLTLEF
jgi:hypothetical protein